MWRKGTVIVPEPKNKLTRRQLAILKWMALGKSDNVIADVFGVSAQDVRNHIYDISQELDTNCRIEASLKAIRLGLV